MPDATLKLKALHFLRLHKGPHILRLPNAWDAATARLFESAGAAALGTTSAGIAFSLGYPDGERIPRGEMMEAVRRICRAVSIPVTADMESGYGPKPEDVAATVREVLEAGAVGLNLEDSAGVSLLETSQQVERIRAACEAAAAAGVPALINARTDVFWHGGDAAAGFDEALGRLKAYRDAGAGCLFAPGLREMNTIARLAREVGAPLNVLAGPGLPCARDLENVGVARLSLGSGPMRASLGLMHRIARELLDAGTYGAMLEGAMPYTEINERMR